MGQLRLPDRLQRARNPLLHDQLAACAAAAAAVTGNCPATAAGGEGRSAS